MNGGGAIARLAADGRTGSLPRSQSPMVTLLRKKRGICNVFIADYSELLLRITVFSIL